MRIALNAMQVRAAKSGVGQYIDGLLGGLLQVDSKNQYVMFNSPENVVNYRSDAANLENVVWGLPEAKKWPRLFHELVRLPGEISRRTFDVFHGLSNFLPVRKKCPYVVSIHDLTYFVQPERCPPLRRRYWYAMTRRTVNVADVIITCSENSRRDLERFFPRHKCRIEVVPYGLHTRYRRLESRIAPATLAQKGVSLPYLLFVGTLEPGKNISRVIEAFDSVAPDFPTHSLVIGGDKGWLFDEIFATAERARNKNRIKFVGHLNDREVVDFMNFCDVFVFPSLYEGFGLPPLEAMACGAPVITSNVSSVPEVVGDAAIMVEPRDTSGLTRELKRVLGDEQLQTELRDRGIEHVKQFSWTRAARETLSIYESVAR